MREIELTQGKVAVVSDQYFEWLNQWNWSAIKYRDTWYAKRNIGTWPVSNKTILMHREITNALGGMQVDHIDGNGLNNQLHNLRLATDSQNKANRGKQRNNKSGYKGVSWDSRARKWNAQIQVNRRCVHLGYFTDPIEAARAYDAAAPEYFGEFARLNFQETRL